MSPSMQPARDRRRKSFRATPEHLEGRQLLAASAALNQQLEAAVQGLGQVLADNGIAERSVTYTYQGIDTPADQQALQQRSNGVAAAAAGGDNWDQAWTAALAARSLLEQAYASWLNGFSNGRPSDWYELQQQAKAVETQPVVFQALNSIADAETDPTWTPPSGAPAPPGPTLIAQNPPQTSPPLQGGVTQNYPDPDGNITLQDGTEVHVDLKNGGPPVEANIDWAGWYYNKLIPMVYSEVFRRDVSNANIEGVTGPVSVTLTYQIFKDGHTVSQITGIRTTGRNQVSKEEPVWAETAKKLMNQFNLPLPQDTQKKSLIRTFTFSLNEGGPAMQLAGPPTEAAATDPNYILDPTKGIHFTGPVHNGKQHASSRPAHSAHGGAHHAHH